MIRAAAQSPAPSGAPDPDLVTPGTIGFLVTLAVVIAVIFLIRDALRRVRRVRARSGASDAYPIPLRRHVVPNQSKLSGPEPVAEAEPSEDSEATEDSEASGETTEASDGENSDAERRSAEVEDTKGSDTDGRGTTRRDD